LFCRPLTDSFPMPAVQNISIDLNGDSSFGGTTHGILPPSHSDVPVLW
uniref:Capsid protein n=1 Tax=Haemonchus placei TaxID=6290 RepID=A0A0N4X2B2_HAEPC